MTHQELIAKHFKDNPGCIVDAYDPEDAATQGLELLENYCCDPKVWFAAPRQSSLDMEGLSSEERASIQEEESRFFEYWISFDVLEKHGYYDDDAVKVYIYEDEDGNVEDFSLELH